MRILVFVGALFFPCPAISHFIWPLSWCLLADFCNHTWIPECGEQWPPPTTPHPTKNLRKQRPFRRLFIDDCDMFEYNCDNNKHYEMIDYAECFKEPICPEYDYLPDVRGGESNCVLRQRNLPYDPIRAAMRKPNPDHIPKRRPFTPPPNLPNGMIQGIRRYKEEDQKRRQRLIYMNLITTTQSTTKTSKKILKRRTREISRTQDNVLKRITTKTSNKTLNRRTREISRTQDNVLKRITLIKNGTMMVKVIKAVGRGTTVSTQRTPRQDSDVLV